MSQSRHGSKGHRILSTLQGNNFKSKIELLESKVKDLEKSFDNIEQDIAGISKQKNSYSKPINVPVEKIWKCSKCSLRLGIYDPEQDLLRVRYKDFYAYFKAGINGYTKVICRSCSHINEVNYIAKEI